MDGRFPGPAGARPVLRRFAATALVAVLVAACGAAPSTTAPTAPPASTGPSASPASETPAATPVPPAGTWVEAGEMTVPREGAHLVLLGDGRVLAVGNDGTSDPLQNTAFCAAPDDATAAELWDPATGQWAATASLATPRALLVAVPLADGRALVTGGASGPKPGTDPWVIGGYQSYSSTWIFDPATEQWAKSGLLDTARAAPAGATLADGRVLVAGGFFADVFRWSDWEFLLGDRYTTCQPPQGDRGGGITTAAWHPGGPLLDVGMPHPPAQALASAEVWDPVSETWSRTGSLNVPRTSPVAVTLADGRVLVADLRGDPYGDAFYELAYDDRAERVADVYDPASGRFRVTGEYPIGEAMLYGSALVALPDGSALLFGNAWRTVGDSETTEEWTAILRYDPATNEWRDAGRLEIRRGDPTVVLLPDGRVLVAGGEDQYGPTLTTEIYDPATETSSAAAPMPEPRVAGRAVVLQDGSVLVAGGYGRHSSMAVRYIPGE